MNVIGKLLMTVAVTVYTFIPPLADLATDTHVFHSDWTPHARFHTVWLLGVTSTIGLIALHCLWLRSGDTRRNVDLAGLLSVVVFGGFFLSALTMGLYGGALSDPAGGVPPAPGQLDANLLVFTGATLVLGTGWLQARR